MPSFCLQPAEDTSLMTALFGSSWRVSWLWPQNSLNSILRSIHNDDHPESPAAHGNNRLWKWQGLYGWRHSLLVWFLRVRGEQDSAGCDTLLPELLWDGQSSICLVFFGRREMEFTVCSSTGQQNETTMSVLVGGCSQPRLWPGKGRKNKESRNYIYSQGCS